MQLLICKSLYSRIHLLYSGNAKGSVMVMKQKLPCHYYGGVNVFSFTTNCWNPPKTPYTYDRGFSTHFKCCLYLLNCNKAKMHWNLQQQNTLHNSSVQVKVFRNLCPFHTSLQDGQLRVLPFLSLCPHRRTRK